MKLSRELNSIVLFLMLSVPLISFTAQANNWPSQPSSSTDPGSAQYKSELFHETLNLKGRTVDFFAPADFQKTNQKLTVIVYGHGQAVPLSSYQDTFVHLARKGMAVVFPQFDTGFFDQDWRRMAADYVNLTTQIIQKYPNSLDASHVIFSGHSKGGYVAGVAAGLPKAQLSTKPAAVVLFDPAGYDAEALRNYDSQIPVTLTWADHDTIIKSSLVQEIYNQLPSTRKQLIQVKSYTQASPDLTADHFFPLTKKFSFGGQDGLTPFHYYGAWKWLLGAAWDLEAGSQITNAYVYGDQTLTTGAAETHQVQKNW
jgi:acetyl esterase/lipase